MNKMGEVGLRNLFKKGDWTGLTYNVFDIKGDILKEFPQLAELRSWKDYTKVDAQKVMKFIIFMFDPGSPLRTKIQQVEERRHASAVLAKYDPREKGYEKIVGLEQEDHLDMIADYLMLIANRDWTMIIVAEMLFNRYAKMAMKEGFSTIKGIPEAMEDVNKKLDTYYNKMFKDKGVAQSIRRGRISAEEIARKTSVQED